MREFWNKALLECIAVSNWYWGGIDDLLASLAVFVVMAHITDVMCAIVDCKLLGRIGIQEMFKSILIFMIVGAGNILDTHVLTNTPALRTMIILFYLSVEGQILLENIVHLGLPVPEPLKKILEQMRQNRYGST